MSQQSASNERVEQIKQFISENVDGGDDLLRAASEEDIDVDEIVSRQLDKRAGTFGDSTIAKFARTAIQNEVEAAKAESMTGLLMGSRDQHGSNGPRRHALVRSNGDHVEMKTWGGTVPGPDGDEIDIPVGAMVEVGAEYDEEWDEWDMVSMPQYKDKSHAELVEDLSKVAVSPDDLTPADAEDYSVAVVRAEVGWFDPQTVFDGDDSDDWYDGDVLMEDSRGEPWPHFEVGLRSEEGRSVRAHAQRLENGRPLFQMPDLVNLCREAVSEFDDPEDQTDLLQQVYQGDEVIVVGPTTSYDTGEDRDGNPVSYYDMGISAIIHAENQTLESFEGESEPDEPESEPDDGSDDESDVAGHDEQVEAKTTIEEADYNDDLRPIASDVDGVSGNAPREEMVEALADELGAVELASRIESGSDDESDDESESEPSAPSDMVAEVQGLLDGYEDLTGETLESVEEVREKIADVDESIDDVAIRAALGDGSAQESAEDEFEALLEGGTYNCPEEDCLASAGSVGELAGHAADEHDTSDYDDPKDWIRAQA